MSYIHKEEQRKNQANIICVRGISSGKMYYSVVWATVIIVLG